MKFYSEVLKKVFDTEKELQEAEEQAAMEKAKKEEASKARKEDAAKVEAAAAALNSAKRKYNEDIALLRKQYHEDLIQRRKLYELTVSEAAKVLEEAEHHYDEELKAFCAAHPEGYHVTLRDGDHVTVINKKASELADIMTGWNQLFESFFKPLF